MSISKNITVLGSGIMGHGIAQVSAMAGYNVILRDIDLILLNKALDKIKWSLSKLAEKNKITQIESETIFKRITPEINLEKSLAGTDFIVEAVPEDLEIKRKLYAEVDRFADEEAIYASNTSTLPITEMAALTKRPDKFIGLHFFNPPQLMRLVEVIPGRETRPETTKSVLDFVKQLGKESVLCKKDVVGFIVNRIFIPLVHEAAYFLDRDGVTMTQLDSAVKYKMGYPMGIFELADYTGLDVIYKATLEMYARDKKVINPHPRIKQLVDCRYFGKKTGRGFYEYSSNSYERINLTSEEAEKYNPIGLVATAANNAAWLISNNVCTKADLDKALNLGMGLKTDLFETVKQFGVKNVLTKLNEMSAKYGPRYEPNPHIGTYEDK
ncbi:3-hydroxyacyl-CoA dehydrogenase family protein [Nitrososphaera sp. AFS]|jgi:enoyl-CoA hydratase/3-hydroxyacyl-CoA dehydrogenase|uniref:3-hydroxyacyl-CoA dehydrogenase family protein n=1 Tax=Nitrososphaera sp. AFS TaxID=2301191 RepID=UPI0013922438|nr:3-hydroxyacyl-CoA dehydrogenase family protein [Nitrososphaera sp. AFS]NAL78206.1 3-hydroxyacyl-CoA dehydrogenase family protein [Nitrososphaera sp. AFS]